MKDNPLLSLLKMVLKKSLSPVKSYSPTLDLIVSIDVVEKNATKGPDFKCS